MGKKRRQGVEVRMEVLLGIQASSRQTWGGRESSQEHEIRGWGPVLPGIRGRGWGRSHEQEVGGQGPVSFAGNPGQVKANRAISRLNFPTGKRPSTLTARVPSCGNGVQFTQRPTKRANAHMYRRAVFPLQLS
ncbi:UNVERIFIED_CONTAM: hypothetical protein K2H54_010556 [Gekko kuhli]